MPKPWPVPRGELGGLGVVRKPWSVAGSAKGLCRWPWFMAATASGAEPGIRLNHARNPGPSVAVLVARWSLLGEATLAKSGACPHHQRLSNRESSVSDKTWLYFAYGSNMATARLCARTPSARVVGTAKLPRHALRWHKLGKDGSGKCDISFVGDAADEVVWGVVYRIGLNEREALDRIEGVGIGYHTREVSVGTVSGELAVRTYQAIPSRIDPTLRPLRWYRDWVLAGAKEHGLPKDYVAMIERTSLAAE